MTQQSAVRVIVVAALFALPAAGALAAWAQYPQAQEAGGSRVEIELGPPQIQLDDVDISGDAVPTAEIRFEDLPLEARTASLSMAQVRRAPRKRAHSPVYQWEHASANGGTVIVWDHQPRRP